MIDTLAAFFDGADMNDNVQGGEFMRRLRPLTRINGLPSVIVSAHPVKNAAADNLVPDGGGAILNEVDGNLTLAQREGTGLTALHWQGKLRGVEFTPALFRIEIASCPDVLDVKGRQVELPVMIPATEDEAESREQAAVNVSTAILKAMVADPKGSIRAWEAASGIRRATLSDRLKSLEREKLVEKTLGKWSVTPKGRKAVGGDEDA